MAQQWVLQETRRPAVVPGSDVQQRAFTDKLDAWLLLVSLIVGVVTFFFVKQVPSFAFAAAALLVVNYCC